MRRTLSMAFAILLFSHANITFANNTDRINGVLNALELWQPIEADYKDGILVVVLPQRNITESIYKPVIIVLCYHAVTTNKVDLRGVKEVAILNQYARSGYVYDGRIDNCKNILNEPINKPNIPLLGNTYVWTGTGY